jgi:hypothetical protein
MRPRMVPDMKQKRDKRRELIKKLNFNKVACAIPPPMDSNVIEQKFHSVSRLLDMSKCTGTTMTTQNVSDTK